MKWCLLRSQRWGPCRSAIGAGGWGSVLPIGQEAPGSLNAKAGDSPEFGLYESTVDVLSQVAATEGTSSVETAFEPKAWHST